jgi:hypothetical protein
MSDFKNIRDFRKSKTSNHPYQDPTYLSFVMLFDFNDKIGSPLLAKDSAAQIYLEKLAKDSEYYAEKLEALQNFKKALRTINSQMPWYWQSLSGLERLLQYDTENPYRGGDESTITVDTLESINLAIAGLMHLYRKAVFDERKWCWVVPANLRKFKVFIYVTEVRTIKNMSAPTISGLSATDFPDNFKPSIKIKNSNSEISGQTARPYFMFELGLCEFDIKSGSSAFGELSKSPEEAASGQIVFTYESLNNIQHRALNGIVESDFNTDKLSPAPDSETESFKSLGDFANSKINQRLEDIASGAITDLQRLSQDKQLEITQAIRNATVNRIPTAENVFQNFVQGIDGATDVNQQTRNIGQAISENVYGTQAGETINGALTRAATNSLGNVYG